MLKGRVSFAMIHCINSTVLEKNSLSCAIWIIGS